MDEKLILDLNKVTNHFKFLCVEKDISCLEEFSLELENNYDRITDDLNYKLKEKVEVRIYPDIDSFHFEVMGSYNYPNWMVGKAGFNFINIVSPLNPGGFHTYNSLLKTVVHEFTHVVVNQINPKGISRLLHEGVASYEARQMDSEKKNIIANSIYEDKVPSIKKLESDFNGNDGYTFAYTIVEFMINRYGISKLNELIRNSKEFEAIFNITEEDFEKQWFEFLNNNYKE